MTWLRWGARRAAVDFRHVARSPKAKPFDYNGGCGLTRGAWHRSPPRSAAWHRMAGCVLCCDRGEVDIIGPSEGLVASSILAGRTTFLHALSFPVRAEAGLMQDQAACLAPTLTLPESGLLGCCAAPKARGRTGRLPACRSPGVARCIRGMPKVLGAPEPVGRRRGSAAAAEAVSSQGSSGSDARPPWSTLSRADGLCRFRRRCGRSGPPVNGLHLCGPHAACDWTACTVQVGVFAASLQAPQCRARLA